MARRSQPSISRRLIVLQSPWFWWQLVSPILTVLLNIGAARMSNHQPLRLVEAMINIELHPARVAKRTCPVKPGSHGFVALRRIIQCQVSYYISTWTLSNFLSPSLIGKKGLGKMNARSERRRRLWQQGALHPPRVRACCTHPGRPTAGGPRGPPSCS